jgi:uncharacterized membrane-anchored protein YhcB (DUF1043 family)
MNTEVATFSDLASIQLSLYPAVYGLIITFLVGCVIGFLFYKFTKNDRYISNTNHAPPKKKGQPKTQQKEDTKKYPTKITRSS